MKKMLFILLFAFLLIIITNHTPTFKEANNKIAIIFTVGGLGDKSFNDLCYDGMLKAQKEFGIDFDYYEPKTSNEYEKIVRQYAEDHSYSIIITVGSEQVKAIEKVAKEFPNKKFIVNDSSLNLHNVVSIKERWEEQIFLNGTIAGLSMKSNLFGNNNTAGVILGKDLQEIRYAAVAFEAGIKYVNPQANVICATVNDFGDQRKAMEIATLMYDKGADLIQHIAGASGLGVFAAADKMDKYAFGVDGKENYFEPEHIVATAVRRINEILFEEIRAIYKGGFQPGVHEYGIENNIVEKSREGSLVVLPRELLEKVDKIKGYIINKKINIPCTKEEINEWIKINQYT